MFVNDEVRKEFPELRDITYINNAAVSLMPLGSRNAMTNSLKDRSLTGEKRTDLRNQRELNVRTKLARLVNASVDEICMVSNTSEGLNIIARGLDLREGDNVVLADCEFPGNVLPWLNLQKTGVGVKVVRTQYGEDPTDNILSTVDENTKVVTVSFVEWIDGFKFNLEEIGRFCAQRDILFVVDAIQGAGALKLDVKSARISFLSAGGFKWLLSPNGTGFIYVAKKIRDRIDLTYLSYLSITDSPMEFNFDFTLRDDATRFRLGSISDTGIAAMEKSLDLILEAGIEGIENHILFLTGYAAENLEKKGYNVLSNMGPEHRSGILTFGGRDIRKKYDELLAHDIIVSFRKEWIRISPHFYNNEDDINNPSLTESPLFWHIFQ